MIYLDHNATSPLLPEVREILLQWLDRPANPSSIHTPGQRAAAAIERAAAQVAALCGGRASDVVFTSGATEANHLWFLGQAQRHVAVGATEHPSVHAAARRAGSSSIIPVDARGMHDYTGLPVGCAVSVMAANHETGVVHDLEPLRGRELHVDASAAAGRIALSLPHASVTLSAHKIGGPLGVGALVSPAIEPMFMGSQQRGRRAGTLNTPGIVAFGLAAELALTHAAERHRRWTGLQTRLSSALQSLGARIVGPPGLPTVVNAVFPGLPAELIVQALDLRGVCVSAGAACASGSVDRSPVLEAMGDPEPDGGVRFSFGWSTDPDDVEVAIAALQQVLEDLDALRT